MQLGLNTVHVGLSHCPFKLGISFVTFDASLITKGELKLA